MTYKYKEQAKEMHVRNGSLMTYSFNQLANELTSVPVN